MNLVFHIPEDGSQIVIHVYIVFHTDIYKYRELMGLYTVYRVSKKTDALSSSN